MDNSGVITIAFTEEEQAIIDALAQERGLTNAEDVLRLLLHDAVEIYDTLWDKTFAETQDVLDQLADEAHAEYLSGQTEDFDPDADEDNV